MPMKCVWEHNGNDTLLYSVDCIGAYTRGNSLEAAVAKMPAEILSYLSWRGESADADITDIEIIEEKQSDLQINDADSDVIFRAETEPLTREEYLALKQLALKSAQDFLRMYLSIPDKDATCLTKRRTFYGNIPTTAREMYEHTKSVNGYYFGEIGVDAEAEGNIYECRKRGFELLEQSGDFLCNRVFDGSYGELWSLRKVIRRFLWHDRIHARAMYRMAVKTFGRDCVENTFKFTL
ncbi:MAG: hypothetical protein IJP17_03130 [Clostridia bacterium]|nr:hypothetical protein [Clostridia bacterium]